MPRCTASAYSPSNGRNMMPNSVVYGGARYLSRMSFASLLSVRMSCFAQASICSREPLS